MTTPRRSFLGRLGALMAIGATPSALAAATSASAGGPPLPVRGSSAPDERWLEALAQREQRMIIETGIIADALAFRRGLNFLEVCNADYSIPDARAGLAIGTHSPALGMVLGDALWAKYALGARFDVRTPQGRPATANPFRAGGPHTVEALHARGVHFLACNRSLMRLGRDLAGPDGDARAVHAELVAGLLPQVIVVPAMVVALSRAQSRGVPYMAVA
jgi:intracellular sulfur oxidation DsrE/DsrF family protein